MRQLRILIGYELRHYFYSPFFYAICALFLFLMGIIFFISLKVYADFTQEEPLMMQLFKSMWLPSLFIVPVLTTKAIVAEKVTHLFDTLLLLRINNLSIVLAKFVVIYLTHMGLWVAASFFSELAQRSAPSLAHLGNFAAPQVRYGGLLFMNLIGGFVIAFGLLVSAQAKTPATSMAASTAGIFLFLVSGQLFKYASGLSLQQAAIFSSLYDNWNVFFQLEDFCHGIFDTRVIIAYVSGTMALLIITAITLRKTE
jgi:ABC-2 type transport system permease protein